MRYKENEMMTFEEIRELRNRTNPFANGLGMVVTEIKEGYARVEVPIQESMENAAHSVHGGLMYTLCDAACGAAAASYQYKVTTVDSSFHYLRPAIECKMLYAVAKEVKHGKRIMVYDVELFDETDKLLCKGIFSMMQLKFPIVPEPETK